MKEDVQKYNFTTTKKRATINRKMKVMKEKLEKRKMKDHSEKNMDERAERK